MIASISRPGRSCPCLDVGHQFGDAIGAVQEAVVGVAVQVDEGAVRHDASSLKPEIESLRLLAILQDGGGEAN